MFFHFVRAKSYSFKVFHADADSRCQPTSSKQTFDHNDAANAEMGNKRKQLPRNSMSVGIQTPSNEGSNNSNNHFWRVTACNSMKPTEWVHTENSSKFNSQSVDLRALSKLRDFFATAPSVSGRHLKHGAENQRLVYPWVTNRDRSSQHLTTYGKLTILNQSKWCFFSRNCRNWDFKWAK